MKSTQNNNRQDFSGLNLQLRYTNDIKLSIFYCVANFYQNIIFYKIMYCSLKSTVVLLSKGQ